jgi:putative membrane protein
MEPDRDPRLYMAAERTFLAWVRTGISLMGFGFVVARFGLFLREMAASGAAPPHPSPGFSLPAGILLIVIGVLVHLVSAVRHSRTIAALDRGEFRAAFDPRVAYGLGALLALVGLVMAVYLARL